jgi:hypothetical protein
MISLEDKIRKVLADSYDGKKFDVAAIIEREDADGRWDLAVSAEWIDEYDFIETVAPKLSEVLSDPELIKLGRLVVLDREGEFMREFNQRLGLNHEEDRDFFNLTIADIPVRHVHVFGAESPFVYA